MDYDFFFTNRSKRTIRVLLVCYARGAGFGAGGKLVFLSQISRVCVHVLYAGCHAVKNASLDASAAGHIAENESKQIFLMITQGIPSMEQYI